ncbi:MAG: hypothetical protein OXN83_00025, partial [Oligoflexia bacterium]|nr:hypothetical protein [Oligoflexia bacterium]
MIRFFWLGSLVFLAFAITGCFYLKKRALNAYLGQFQDKKAEQVDFEALPSAYHQRAHSTLDVLWWNDDLGTSISYFSSCSDVPKNLESFQASTYPLKFKRTQFIQTTESLYSVLEVPHSQNNKTYMAIYTIQRKNCYFNI